jgi:hypothetical protein
MAPMAEWLAPVWLAPVWLAPVWLAPVWLASVWQEAAPIGHGHSHLTLRQQCRS